MIRLRKLSSRAAATVTAGILTFALTGVLSGAHAQGFRPEIGNPLQAASKLAKEKKYSEAMAKVREAEAVSGRTAAENAAIEQMRGYIASTSGDVSMAVKSYETQIDSGSLSGEKKLQAMQAVASLYYQAKDYPKAMQWAQRYIKEGGTGPQMRNLPTQLAFLGGDCSTVVKQVQADVQAATSAGRTPSEDQLQLLANCASKQKDNTAYVGAMEKLVTFYPKKEYWADLLNRVERKPGFSSRLGADVYRLKQATGNLNTATDYMEMAQLALQDGQTSEAKKIVDQGYLIGVLGTGPDVERQKRLKALVDKRVAERKADEDKKVAEAKADPDGTDLLNLGYNYVMSGEDKKGLGLMEDAVKKGVKRQDDGKLLLGIAYIQAGDKANGVKVLKTVGGTDGTADLARLWSVVRPVAAPAGPPKTGDKDKMAKPEAKGSKKK